MPAIVYVQLHRVSTQRWSKKSFAGINSFFIVINILQLASQFCDATNEHVNFFSFICNTGWAKKLHTVFKAITFSAFNHFNNFWHIYTIGNLQLDDA